MPRKRNSHGLGDREAYRLPFPCREEYSRFSTTNMRVEREHSSYRQVLLPLPPLLLSCSLNTLYSSIFLPYFFLLFYGLFEAAILPSKNENNNY